MIKHDELVTMRAIAICFKPFLKPEEALIYCNLGRTQFAKLCFDNGVHKSNTGYYRKEDLDKILAGETQPLLSVPSRMKMRGPRQP